MSISDIDSVTMTKRMPSTMTTPLAPVVMMFTNPLAALNMKHGLIAQHLARNDTTTKTDHTLHLTPDDDRLIDTQHTFGTEKNRVRTGVDGIL